MSLLTFRLNPAPRNQQECYKKNQTFQALLDAKLQKNNAFDNLEVTKKSKAAANLVMENSQQNLNDLLALLSYYDQKRALASQQMEVCNQCPKMKQYQDANKDAEINYEKYKAQYTLAEMAMKNADLGVRNASIASQAADAAASNGVETVSSLSQELASAEKSCDEKFPEEAAAKAAYKASKDAEDAFKRQKEAETKAEIDRLLEDRRSRSYYLSMRAGAHVDFGVQGYDAVAAKTSGTMTLSTWVKLGSLSRPMTLLSARGEHAGDILGWTLGVAPEDGFYFDVTTEGSSGLASERVRALSSKNALPPTKIQMGTWYFVAVTWGEECKLWINGYNVARSKGGVIVYEPNQDSTGAGKRTNAGRRLTIGALLNGDNSLTGAVDNIGIWAREATGEELQADCQKGNSTSRLASRLNDSNENLVAFYDFGPKFDLGSTVVGSIVAVATSAPKGSVVGNNTATWIPDDDSKVFCGKLSNSLGRKLIRRLSRATAQATQTDDVNCKQSGQENEAMAESCPDSLCQPRTEGGVALYLDNSIFGSSAGQIPKLGLGKQITKAHMLLSLAPLEIDNGDSIDEWTVEAFSVENGTSGESCVKDNILTEAKNGTLRISASDIQNGRIMVDISNQLRALSLSTPTPMSQRGIFFTRKDPSSAKSDIKFFSPQTEKPEHRPQMIVGITDGDQPPVRFEEGADTLCQTPRKMCTARELEMAAGFDGYSERACGYAVRGNLKAATRVSRKGRAVECNEVKGVFCCSQNTNL